jgi:hypothetical protein
VHTTAVHTAVVHTSVANASLTSSVLHALQTGIGPLIPAPFAFTPALEASEEAFARSYAAAHGGLLPKDAFWEYLIYRHGINPTTFETHHPQIASLLAVNEAVTNQDNLMCPPAAGLVPNTPYWNYLRYRHDSSPVTFDHYHPQLAALLDQDEALRQQEGTMMNCPTAPQQIIPPTVVPPPSGVTTPPVTVTGGNFTPGTPLQVPGGQTTPPQMAVPEPSSIIVLTSGLLLVFVAARLLRVWARSASQRLVPAKV